MEPRARDNCHTSQGICLDRLHESDRLLQSAVRRTTSTVQEPKSQGSVRRCIWGCSLRGAFVHVNPGAGDEKYPAGGFTRSSHRLRETSSIVFQAAEQISAKASRARAGS